MTDEYKAALAKNDRAIARFREIQVAYRARILSDDQFLAARLAYDDAMHEFDIAFAREQARGRDQQ